MIFIQIIASFIAVAAFSINIEVPKKYIGIAGCVGAIGWVTYLGCMYLNIPEIRIINVIKIKLLERKNTIFVLFLLETLFFSYFSLPHCFYALPAMNSISVPAPAFNHPELTLRNVIPRK